MSILNGDPVQNAQDRAGIPSAGTRLAGQTGLVSMTTRATLVLVTAMQDSSDPGSPLADSYEKAQRILQEALVSAGGTAETAAVECLIARHGNLASELRELWESCRGVQVALEAEARRHAEQAREFEQLLQSMSTPASFDDRYDVQAEVGAGGMGAVYRVFDRHLGRSLAMKLILGQASSARGGATPPVPPLLLARFLDEARITSQLDHPGIVPVHEVGVDASGRAYFTMKLVKGRRLADVFVLNRAGDTDWGNARVLGLIQRACEAVAFAHEHGVVHRDLKPSNVMVGDFGEVYVMDWGLARRRGEAVGPRNAPAGAHRETDSTENATAAQLAPRTADGRVMGTPAYMAPELARGGAADANERADVYAIGAVLYEFASGHPPYCLPGQDASATAVLRRIGEGPPEPLDRSIRARRMPPELAAVVAKAMARDPAARYLDVRELSRDLTSLIEGRVVSAFRTGAWPELAKWTRRNPALALSVAGIVLLLVVAGALGLERAGSERLARRRLAAVVELSTPGRVERLVERADALWPLAPVLRTELEAWMSDARHLLQEAPRPAPASGPARAHTAVDAGIPQDVDEVLREQEQRLFAKLAWFASRDAGPMHGTSPEHGPGVSRRLALLAELEVATLTGESARRAWAEAASRVAADERFHGFVLAPVFGLLPIGEDPRSGLPEFAHIASGSAPTRDARGELQLEESSGIVLVLLPGGASWMGSPPGAAARSVLGSSREEHPQHLAVLTPFYFSKFETTQGQFSRLAGRNPSRWNPETYRRTWNRNGRAGSLLHPVESVSWEAAMEFARWASLDLPTEAQWEFAARAGSTSFWPDGDREACLEGSANVSDRFAAANGADWTNFSETLDDGHLAHAPVGNFRANAFGLHDLLGNVWEWCRDGYANYTSPCRDGDGERLAPWEAARVTRGGSFTGLPRLARPGYRDDKSQQARESNQGFRLALSLDAL